MNPVVVDIQGKYACILTEDGEFLKIKNKNYQIGERIEYKEEKFSPKLLSFKYLATALALVLVVGTSAGVYAYPYGTVSLDVNPSITYTINVFDRVIGVDGVNDDGEKFAENLDSVKNKKIEEAINSTIVELQEKEYISNDEENYVVVTVNTKNEEHSVKVVANVEANTIKEETVELMATVPTEEMIEKAQELNTTPGKVWLIEKTIETLEDEDIDVEELVKEPIKEIIKKSRKFHETIGEITDPRPDKEEHETKVEEKAESKLEEAKEKLEKKLKKELEKEIKKELKKEIEKETGEKINSDEEIVEKIIEIINEDTSDELQDLKDSIEKVLPDDVDITDLDPSNLDLSDLSFDELKDIGLKGLEWVYSHGKGHNN